jgi:hypothetical protein
MQPVYKELPHPLLRCKCHIFLAQWIKYNSLHKPIYIPAKIQQIKEDKKRLPVPGNLFSK